MFEENYFLNIMICYCLFAILVNHFFLSSGERQQLDYVIIFSSSYVIFLIILLQVRQQRHNDKVLMGVKVGEKNLVRRKYNKIIEDK